MSIINWFGSPATKIRKKIYAQGQQGIINRYLREKEHWDKHLLKTREAILQFSQKQNHHQTAIILGSGWLLDIPVEELSRQYEKLILVDLFHPAQIQHKMQKFSNVHLLETDLTGGFLNSVETYLTSKKKKDKIALDSIQADPDANFCSLFSPGALEKNGITPRPCKESIVLHQNRGTLFSVNLLSQLDGLLVDYLLEAFPYTQEEFLPFRKKLQNIHYSLLKSHAPSCLITDYQEEIYSNNSTLEKKRPLVWIDLANSQEVNRWNWVFDTTGSYEEGKSIRLKVKCFHI